MKIKKYLIDKILFILIYIFLIFLITLLLLGFKATSHLIIAILIILIIGGLSLLLIDFSRKKVFYNKLLNNINLLDKSYLVLETLEAPSFYEGELLYEALYEINKSYLENIKNYKTSINDFKEYIEMWIHEIKIPLSSLTLIAHNHKNEFTAVSLKEMKRIDDYLEQILYYIRSENANKDYFINEVNLEKIINNVALRNKDSLSEYNIDFLVNNTNLKVLTDSKWLEFILNQIINNSIKYIDPSKKSYIKVSAKELNEKIIIEIEDNGIGIDECDLPRVFEKSFTGTNGRIKVSSTGMGLFIVKSLCSKLGHTIIAESKKNEYTRITITISKNKFYDVAK